jgi:MYXO-CTERM domain-containing protein
VILGSNGRRRALATPCFAALVAAAALLGPAPASAWTCVETGCPRWSGSIPVGLGALSDDLEAIAPGTTQAELERALGDWSRVECAEVPLEAVMSTDAPLDAVDGVSTVGFVESGWTHDLAAIGVTLVQRQACSRVGGCIVEADTVFNGEGFTWVTKRGALPEVNAYSIALHEMGHYLGLGHTIDADAAMNASYARGYLLLNDDDEAGLCSLYPREGEPADCAAEGCPFGQACVEGQCEPAPLESCVTAMDCASDEVCIQGTGRCVRRSISVPGLGTACEVDTDCESQECAELPSGRRCTLTCDGLDPRSCPSGFYCDPGLTDACGTGLCVAGKGGAGTFGSPCEASTECASLFCDRGVCTVPCDAAATDNCPASDVCHPDAATGCGACLPPLPLGEACLTNIQCASALCYSDDPAAEGVCSTPCAADDDCPGELRCAPAGDEGLCLPPPPSGGCGCSAPGRPGSGGAPLAFGLFVAFLAMRIRRSTSRSGVRELARPRIRLRDRR